MALSNPILSLNRWCVLFGEKLVGEDDYPILDTKQTDGVTGQALFTAGLLKNVKVCVAMVESNTFVTPGRLSLQKDSVIYLSASSASDPYEPVFTEITTDGQQLTAQLDDYKNTFSLSISGDVFGSAFNGQKTYQSLPVLLIRGNAEPYDVVEEVESGASGVYSFSDTVTAGEVYSVCVPKPSWSGSGTINDADIKGKFDADFDGNLDFTAAYGEAMTFINKRVHVDPAQVFNTSTVCEWRSFVAPNPVTYLQYHVLIEDEVSGSSKLTVWFVRNRGWGSDPKNLPLTVTTDLDVSDPPSNFFAFEDWSINLGSFVSLEQRLITRWNLNKASVEADLTSFCQEYLDTAAGGWSGSGASLWVGIADDETTLQNWIDEYVDNGVFTEDGLTTIVTFDTGETL